METTVARQIFDLLRSAKKPVLISDKRIDGDSMGSSLAVLEYLRCLGKETVVYVPSEVPEQYRFLPNAERCTFDPAIFNDPEIDLVVSFDCSEAAYIQGLMKLIPGRPTLVNIDHHATNARYGDVNLVVVGSPATAEVVHAFFKVNDVVLSRDAATCLLAGLCFDTTIFTNGGTDERAFQAASELLLRGGRIQDVIQALFRNRTVGALRLWGMALERLEKHEPLGVLSTYLTRADLDGTGVTDDEADGLSDFLNLVTDAHTLVVMRETKDKGVKASMRSTKYDVSAVAKSLGGGGHVKAAGFSVVPAALPTPADAKKFMEKILNPLANHPQKR